MKPRSLTQQSQFKGEPMPLTINVGLSKKVGESNYGSRGASVNLELELDSSLAQEPTKPQEKIRQLFGIVRTSLAEELNGGNGQSHASKGNSNGNAAPAAFSPSSLS